MIEVVERDICCGCGVCSLKCVKKCITMAEDKEGFLYPHINEKDCIDCGLCQKSCPVLNRQIPDGNPAVYAALHKNKKVRKISSSGGIFYALAKKHIYQGGVVCAARMDYGTQKVKHDFLDETNFKDIAEFCGSKYVESDLGNCFEAINEYLQNDRKVLFVGTPCQAAALKRFVSDDKNLLCCDFICHGVPGRKVFKLYLDEKQKLLGDKVNRVQFRNKQKGWKLYSMYIKTNKKDYCSAYCKDSYLRAFRADLDLRPSCYQCSFKSIRRISDITLGDFWGIRQYIKGIHDYYGVSYVAVQTEKGNAAFQSIASQLEVYKMDSSILYQPALTQSAELSEQRDKFMSTLQNSSFTKTVNEICPVNKKSCFTENLKSVLELWRR